MSHFHDKKVEGDLRRRVGCGVLCDFFMPVVRTPVGTLNNFVCMSQILFSTKHFSTWYMNTVLIYPQLLYK